MALLKSTSNASPRLSIFDRAKLRVGNVLTSAGSKPKPAARSEGLLAKFQTLQGAEKTAFFRANLDALKAEAAALPPSVQHSNPARQAATSSQATGNASPAVSAATALLENFNSMVGAKKIAFFRTNKELLESADALVSLGSSAGDKVAADREERAARNFAVSLARQTPTATDRDLLETFEGLTGTARILFFRQHQIALRVAASGLSARN